MLIDDIQPEYDVIEVHAIQVRASARTVFDCIKTIAPSEIAWVMRALVWLRLLPERLVGRQEAWFHNEEPLLSQMSQGNFTLLVEEAPKEIVLGMLVPAQIGRVWRKSSALNKRADNARDFFAFDNPEYVRVVMNLLVEDSVRPGCVSVRTETRCRALSPRALKKFTPYWRLIRPFSGLIRIVWLKAIKRKAKNPPKV